MKCPKCGKVIEENSVFCEYCGGKVKRAKWPWLFVVAIISVVAMGFVVFRISKMRNEEFTKEEFFFSRCASPSDYRQYVKMYPDGQFVSLANNKIRQFVNDSITEIEKMLAVENIAYSNCTTANACRNYLRRYPTGRYVTSVQQRLDVFFADSIAETKKLAMEKMEEYSGFGIEEEKTWDQETLLVEEEEMDDDEIYQIVEEMPQFPGGETKLIEYIAKNIKYPQVARETGIQGRVFVGFVVEPDGSISNVKLLRGIGGGCDEEAVRVIKSMPRWKSGKHRGKAVRVSYQIPVLYKLT